MPRCYARSGVRWAELQLNFFHVSCLVHLGVMSYGRASTTLLPILGSALVELRLNYFPASCSSRMGVMS